MGTLRCVTNFASAHAELVGFVMSSSSTTIAIAILMVGMLLLIGFRSAGEENALVAFLSSLNTGLWVALAFGWSLVGFAAYIIVAAVLTASVHAFVGFAWRLWS